MDIVEQIMSGIVRAVTWVAIQLGMGLGSGLHALFLAASQRSGVRSPKQDTQLAKKEQEENQRIAECRTVVLDYARLQGHVARECMSREELEEMIDNGATGKELSAELNRRISETPGIILGVNQRIPDLRIKLPLSQMERHTYMIGRSGSGKTNLIRSMILQNIYSGHGIAVIAPEPELLTSEIMPYIPPERVDDVVYINPADTDYPISINPLFVENNENIGQKVEDMVTIFKRIVGDTGARMDHILNNALHALAERKDSTLFDVPKLLTNPSFQKEILQTTKDPQTRDFFENEYPQYQKGAHLPITSRLGAFTRREAIRNLLCQPGRAFNFRKAMDEGKILLFNVADGLLGAESSQILGQIIVSKIQLAAMSRADTPAANRRPFYLYMDEFQAFTEVNAKSYEIMLSRARKYRLNLILANQHTHQLPGDLLHAILGNVATIIAFSVSREDAEKLAKQYVIDTGAEMLEIPSEEFLRLKTGEAWGKIGQSIFPLRTMLVDQNPDLRRTEYVIAKSRYNYGLNGNKQDSSPKSPPDERSLPPHDDGPNDEPPNPGKIF